MQILFKRGQSEDWLGLTKFDLWAKFDITPEERELLEKYRSHNAILSRGDFRRDVRKAAFYALPITVFAILFLSAAGALRADLGGLIFLACAGFFVLTFFIYQNIRETIRVCDITSGRTFVCRDITKLIEKENIVLLMGQHFRHFLETMKTWGGVTVVDVDPYQPPALRIHEDAYAAD